MTIWHSRYKTTLVFKKYDYVVLVLRPKLQKRKLVRAKIAPENDLNIREGWSSPNLYKHATS